MNFSQTNFDIISYSLLAIFTNVTLEGWTNIMYATSKAYTPYSFILYTFSIYWCILLTQFNSSWYYLFKEEEKYERKTVRRL